MVRHLFASRSDMFKPQGSTHISSDLKAPTYGVTLIASVFLEVQRCLAQGFATLFALGEAVAHLNLLWLSGQMQRERGADGVLRFSTTPPGVEG